MSDFLDVLEQHKKEIEDIGIRIENREPYLEALRKYLPQLNEMIVTIFDLQQNSELSLNLNQEFVLQVLTDIVYGIEQEDSVFLLDVLRYGLLEIYNYICIELQSGRQYE